MSKKRFQRAPGPQAPAKSGGCSIALEWRDADGVKQWRGKLVMDDEVRATTWHTRRDFARADLAVLMRPWKEYVVGKGVYSAV